MKKSEFYLSFMLWYVFFQIDGTTGNWEEWWTYDGISGPDFWGLLNPEWSLCTKGRRQSPVDLNPEQILYDPYLRPLNISSHRVSGVLSNTGHSVAFRVSNLHPSMPINISGGPLSYKYRFHELHLHYGRTDDRGSEHTVSGSNFPGEEKLSRNQRELLVAFLATALFEAPVRSAAKAVFQYDREEPLLCRSSRQTTVQHQEVESLLLRCEIVITMQVYVQDDQLFVFPSTDRSEGSTYAGQDNMFNEPSSNRLLCLCSQTSPDLH
ncbi:carbonic anhydrase-related protein 10-like [Uloborus diversus]|uniref:carbonic anhydrase-related protein 10-like n=1 Tax=Uloborus diversus TaxID=327109 RepID=UPI0024098B51|nr:carbonic anhydrase-related protein 10-like [Uloborus diversus]